MQREVGILSGKSSRVRSLQGEFEKAREDFDRALAINPNDIKTIKYCQKLNSSLSESESLELDEAEIQLTPIQQSQKPDNFCPYASPKY